MTPGSAIAILAAAAFVGLVLYGLSFDLRHWWQGRHEDSIRPSDLAPAPSLNPEERERMETLRRQLDELWADDEDPRAEAVQDAAVMLAYRVDPRRVVRR